MRHSGIYKIENKINRKVYIGQSTDIKKRWLTHIKSLRLNKHQNIKLQTDYNNYGENAFEFNVLRITESNRELYLYESYYVDLFKTFKVELYNIKNLHSYKDILDVDENIHSYIKDLKTVLDSLFKKSSKENTTFKIINFNDINNLTQNRFDKTNLSILMTLIEFDYCYMFREYGFNLYEDNTLGINYTPYNLIDKASSNHYYMRNLPIIKR